MVAERSKFWILSPFEGYQHNKSKYEGYLSKEDFHDERQWKYEYFQC